MREVFIPSPTLHIVQNWILINILNKILPSKCAMAFRTGNAYGQKQNAIYHAQTLYGLSLDIKDFFPSINDRKVYTIYSSIGYNNFAATILTNLCTINGKLPQGSACSPAISNLICITLDRRLIGLCEKQGIRYSRYADDMYFSCDDKVLLLKILPIIKQIILDEGFIINDKKTHFHTPSNKKQITGVTVSSSYDSCYELKASKVLKRKIRAEIFRCMLSGNYENRDHIMGEISYVSYVEKENKTSYLERIKKYIKQIMILIESNLDLVDAYNNHLFFNDLIINRNESPKGIETVIF